MKAPLFFHFARERVQTLFPGTDVWRVCRGVKNKMHHSSSPLSPVRNCGVHVAVGRKDPLMGCSLYFGHKFPKQPMFVLPFCPPSDDFCALNHRPTWWDVYISGLLRECSTRWSLILITGKLSLQLWIYSSQIECIRMVSWLLVRQLLPRVPILLRHLDILTQLCCNYYFYWFLLCLLFTCLLTLV